MVKILIKIGPIIRVQLLDYKFSPPSSLPYSLICTTEPTFGMNIGIRTDVSSRVYITINDKQKFGEEFSLSCNYDFRSDFVYWRWNNFSLFHVQAQEKFWSNAPLYKGKKLSLQSFLCERNV